MKSEAIEGLLNGVIFAEVSLTSESFTPRSASELANRDREAVYDGEALITVSLLDHLLPKSLFDFPQVSSLSNKSSAMKRWKSREEMRGVAAEVVEDGLVLAQTEILTNNFNGEDFAVSKPRLRPTRSQPLMANRDVESIVNETKHSYNEGIDVQGKRPPIGDWQSLLKALLLGLSTLTQKLAHRVTTYKQAMQSSILLSCS